MSEMPSDATVLRIVDDTPVGARGPTLVDVPNVAPGPPNPPAYP